MFNFTGGVKIKISEVGGIEKVSGLENVLPTREYEDYCWLCLDLQWKQR